MQRCKRAIRQNTARGASKTTSSYLGRHSSHWNYIFKFSVENTTKCKPRLSGNQTLVSDSLVLSPPHSLSKSLPLASQCPVALGSLVCVVF